MNNNAASLSTRKLLSLSSVDTWQYTVLFDIALNNLQTTGGKNPLRPNRDVKSLKKKKPKAESGVTIPNLTTLMDSPKLGADGRGELPHAASWR